MNRVLTPSDFPDFHDFPIFLKFQDYRTNNQRSRTLGNLRRDVMAQLGPGLSILFVGAVFESFGPLSTWPTIVDSVRKRRT